MKTNELIGPALDWAVAKCEGLQVNFSSDEWVLGYLSFSTEWGQSGPIIEREDISFRKYHNPSSEAHGIYYAKVCRESGSMVQWSKKYDSTGPTPLIAAMRAYVASKLGESIEIPEELSCHVK